MAKVKVSQWVSEWQGHLLSCSGQLKTIELQVQVVTIAAVEVLWKAPAGMLHHQGFDQLQPGFHVPEVMLSAQRVWKWIVPVLIIGALHRSPFLSLPHLPTLNPDAQISRPILISSHLKFSSNWRILPRSCLFSERKQTSSCQSSALKINYT